MHVICVHGYLAPKAILWPLTRGLRRLGHRAETFGYPSHRGRLETHAARLARVVADHDTEVAIVGHSLGGLLVHALLRLHPDAPVSRRVFIATPHQGCRTARGALRTPLARLVSDGARRAAVGMEAVPHASPAGVIVGSRDMMVRPDEAELPGAAHLELPFGHNELMMRPQTLHAVDRFLRYGAFEAPLDLSWAT